jgi:hypothetical protein
MDPVFEAARLPAQSKNLQKDVFNGYIVGNRNWNPEGEVFKVTSANYGTPSTLKRNDRFEIAAASINRETLPQAIAMSFGSNRNPTKVRFQINCNAPLCVGDQFGPIKIVGYANTKGDSCAIPDNRAASNIGSISSTTSTPASGSAIVGLVAGVMLVVVLMVGVYRLAAQGKSISSSHTETDNTPESSVDVGNRDLVWDNDASKENPDSEIPPTIEK